jgi:hypothetical protein
VERDHGPPAESFHTTRWMIVMRAAQERQSALAELCRLKGKFRPSLRTSFRNHLSDQVDRARRLKRGRDQDFVQLDASHPKVG